MSSDSGVTRVKVTEDELPERWQRLLDRSIALPNSSLHVPQPAFPTGGPWTAPIAILIVAALFGYIVLVALSARPLVYLVWTAVMFLPHLVLWPRYLASVRREKARIENQRWGLLLLPDGLLLRESFVTPPCTLLGRGAVLGSEIVHREVARTNETTRLEKRVQIRYRDDQGAEGTYETPWVPGGDDRLARIISAWADGSDPWDGDGALPS